MGFFTGFSERIRAFVRRAREETEMDEELRFHLEMETERYIREGVPPDQAHRKAVIAFGGLEGHREAVRGERGFPWMEEVGLDLRRAFRSLRRTPGFTLVTVSILGLGVGSSVAMFGTIRVMTEPVPYPEYDRLFSVSRSGTSPTLEEFRAWEGAVGQSAMLAGFSPGGRAAGDGAGTTLLFSRRVTENFFPVLGATPAIGRGLLADDFQPESEPVAVISNRLWLARFGGDPRVLGRTVELNGLLHTVVGVLGAGTQFPAPVDIWIPLIDDGTDGPVYLDVIGRRADGSEAEVRTALQLAESRLDGAQPPDGQPRGIDLGPLMLRMAPEAELGLLLFRGVVLVLLLISIANAAGMILTRSLERGREVAIRASLGASRWRIFRQFMLENGVLALTAGAFGLVVAYVMLGLMRSGLPVEIAEQILGWERLRVDFYALGLAVGLSVIVALGCGVGPAWRVSRRDPSIELRQGSPGSTEGPVPGRLAKFLLAGQVAAAVTLLLVAGLLSRNLSQLLSADLGFDPAGIMVATFEVPADRIPSSELDSRLLEPLRDRLRATGGPTPIGLISTAPMSRPVFTQRYREQGSDPGTEARSAAWRVITPGLLREIGLPIVRGRGFEVRDVAGAPRVAIISESLARRSWPDGADPIGKALVLDEEEEPWTVIGVAQDIRNPDSAAGHEATLYVPQAQAPFARGAVVLRAAPGAADRLVAVQDAIWSVDPGVAIGGVATMNQMVADYFADQRAMAAGTGIFSVLALAITIYSLLALVTHATLRRRREIGIRLALGARASRIIRGSMLQGMRWVALGGAVGLGLAAGLARLLASLLSGIDPLDPIVFTIVPAAVLLLAAVASWLPARRVARVDVVATLRAD